MWLTFWRRKEGSVQFAVELRSKLSYAYEIAQNMKKNTDNLDTTTKSNMVTNSVLEICVVSK